MATTPALKNYGGGWAIVVGGAGLFVVGGTRFGVLAAGLTSIALLFQLVSLVGKEAGTSSAPAALSTPASTAPGQPAAVATPSLSQVFNFG